MSWMDEAMNDLQPWIGRVRIVEDDVGLMSVRRAAGTFNVDPATISRGTEAAAALVHAVLRVETVHADASSGRTAIPKKGVVLPPIPMPRRMGAGRRVKVMGRLPRRRARREESGGAPTSSPRAGRSGDIFVLTMRHTYEQGGKTIAVDEMDAHLSATAVPAGQKTRRRCRPRRALVTPGGAHRTHQHAQFPLLGADLERPPHPLRRRLHAHRGRLSRPSSPTAACRCT